MQFTAFINDAVSELRHVRWPTRHQAIRLSAITIGFVICSAAAFGAIDYVLNQVVTLLLSLTY